MLIPLTKWPNYYPWPSVYGLRSLVKLSAKNGFHKVFIKTAENRNGRILIDEEAFHEWMLEKRKRKLR